MKGQAVLKEEWEIWASGAMLRESSGGGWRSDFEGSSLICCSLVNIWEASGIL